MPKPNPETYQAYSFDDRNNRPAGVFVGTLMGTKEDCIEWLDVTRPGWRDDYECGRAALRKVNVWVIDQERIAEDREKR